MALVILEAVSETKIIQYTGDIVDIGVEQSGIENCVPLIIDNKTRANLINLSDEKNQHLILQSYQKLANRNQIQKNNNLKNINIDFENKNLYIISENSNLSQLEQAFTTYYSIIIADKNNNPKSLELKKILINGSGLKTEEAISKQLHNLKNSEKTKVFKIISTNAQKSKNNVLSNLILQEQKNNYQALDVSLEQIQNNYIKTISSKIFISSVLADIPYILIVLISAVCAAKIAQDLRDDVFKKINKFSNIELDKFSIPSLITRTTNDINQIQFFIFICFETIFFAPIYALMSFKQSYLLNKNMSWIIIYIILIILSVIILILFIVVPKYTKIQKLIDKLNLITREILNGVLYIRALNAEKFEEKRFDTQNKIAKKLQFSIEKIMVAIQPWILLISNTAILIIVYMSHKYVSINRFQIGDVLAYINYTITIITSFIMMSISIIEFPRTFVSLKRVFEVINQKLAIQYCSETKSNSKNNFQNNTCRNINNQNHEFSGKITFRDVSFTYPHSDFPTLKNISFEIKPGTITAIVGPTGCGKSTIVNLIQRFYDVSDGAVLLDNIDIKNIFLDKLREQISLAPQKSSLFQGTVKSNVAYGNKNISDKELENILAVAEAKKFVEKKTDKFETEISQKGTNISGGQKQRLSIARAIAKKAKIYIFDDSFSALDLKTDCEVRKNLRRHLSGATIIIVAQRIRTILDADQIIVLDKGQIVGKGTHSKLLKSCNQYYNLAKEQLLKNQF